VLVHSARSLGAENEMVITVLPGSGTGELSGITGTARITPEHAFILDYELGS
jgi:Protein of unknown function (DUF3224)